MGRVNEIMDIINDNNLLQWLFHCSSGWSTELDHEFETDEEYVESLGLKNFGIVDSREDSSEFWSVIHFKDENLYFRISGTYDSYGQGEHEYRYISPVKPKEITTTIYINNEK